MQRRIRVLAILTMTAVSAAAQNQPPAQGMLPMPPMGGQRGNPAAGAMVGARAAQMLLARSAQLDLTDAQVTRLAGIARRAELRQRTMRTAMDSARTRFAQPGDSIARRQFAQKMPADITKERDQARVDLRDAITVLTPDQQARAWEMNAARRAMRGGGGQGGVRGGRGGMRRGGVRGGMGSGRPARPPFDESRTARNPE